MVESMLKVIHILGGLQQAEHLRVLNVYGLQSRKLGDWHERTRSWSGDSKNCCVWDFDVGSWHETCHGKFVPQLLLPERKEHRAIVANDLIQATTNEPDFLNKVITLKETGASLSYVQCFYIFFNKCLYFSYYTSGCFLDRHCTFRS